jgi:hypothetical protein
MTEAEYIKKTLKPYLKKRGFQKIHKSTEKFSSGWPDLTCIHVNGVLFIEAKIYPKRPTPIQIQIMKEIVQAGGDVIVFSYDSKRKEQITSFIDYDGDMITYPGGGLDFFEQRWKGKEEKQDDQNP